MRLAILSDVVYPTNADASTGLAMMALQQAEELHKRGHDVTLFGKEGSSAICKTVSVQADGYKGERVLAKQVIKAHREHAFDAIVDNGHLHTLSHLYPDLPVLNIYHDIYQDPRQNMLMLSYGQVAMMSLQHKSFRVLYNARPALQKPDAEPTRDYLLFIGAIHVIKQPLLAIQIAAAAGMKLVMAGESVSGWWPAVNNDMYEYVGTVRGKRKVDLIYNAAAVLQLGVGEAFGLTTIEALQLGTPVIGLASGATPEIVRHSRDGWLVERDAPMVKWVDAVHQVKRMAAEDCMERGLQFADVQTWVHDLEGHIYSVAQGEWW